MPIIVNGEAVPHDLIREEAKRVRDHPDYRDNGQDHGLAERVWAAAELAAVNRILIFQAARQDETPIESELIDKEVQRQRASAGCRQGFDEGALRLQVESSLRYTKAAEKIAGNVPKPTSQDVLQFYKRYRENFRRPPSIRARHIVKHIDEVQNAAQALAGIQVAEAALIAGASFADVIANHSDCTDNSGDLGTFERGIMVEEFDNVVFSLRLGERSGIFQTPFGYHIAEVTECNADGIADFEDVRDDIERVMIAMTTQEKLLRGLETLRTRSTITRVANQNRRGHRGGFWRCCWGASRASRCYSHRWGFTR